MTGRPVAHLVSRVNVNEEYHPRCGPDLRGPNREPPQSQDATTVLDMEPQHTPSASTGWWGWHVAAPPHGPLLVVLSLIAWITWPAE